MMIAKRDFDKALVLVLYTNLSMNAVHARGLVDVVAGTCVMSIVGEKTYDTCVNLAR